jgi:hypothetical protein
VNCNRLQHGYSSTAKANIDNSSNLQWWQTDTSKRLVKTFKFM